MRVIIIMLTKKLYIGLLCALSATFVHAQETNTSSVNLKEFRFSYDKMYDIASPKKLPHRIFYTKPSVGPNAAWFDAVKKGDLKTVKRMVEEGQNIDVKDEAALGQTALGWAAFIGYQDMVEYLVGKGADLYATDRADVYNVFKSAVLGKNIKTVKYLYPLLKDNISVDEQEQDGETLVMVAASNNRIDIVKFLLKLGADVNVVSEQKNASALSFACEGGYKDMVKLLIKAGAINHKTKKSSC